LEEAHVEEAHMEQEAHMEEEAQVEQKAPEEEGFEVDGEKEEGAPQRGGQQ
jgi:hypothetical protein